MTIVRPEFAHAINGINGRMFNAIKTQPSKARHTPDTFASQTWKTSKEYHEGGQKYEIIVTVRFDDECGNGHNSFSITGNINRWNGRRWEDDMAGCIHDEITKHFPEFAHLIRWHCVSTDGPMHYIEDTTYHAQQGKLDYARSAAVWPEATDAQLSVPTAELKAALLARLPVLMAAFKADIEAAGFLWSAKDKQS